MLRPDESTADQYGRVQAELARSGTPIPQNDAWIAALARQHHLPIATRDAHFSRVAGLTALPW
jgi:predicted nucleic acid-binding protein